MPNISRIVAGGLLALFVALIFEALSVFGIISMLLGHLCVLGAGIVGALIIATELIPGKPTKHKAVWIAVLALVLFLFDRWGSEYKSRYESEPHRASALLPAPSDKNSAPPDVRAPLAKQALLPPHELKLIFKNSPLFTKPRQDRIGARMESFYRYLANLGLNPPEEVPPIGTGRTYGTVVVDPGPVYMDTIRIPENAVDDPMAPARAYAIYCFHVLLGSFATTIPDHRRESAAWIFEGYFVASFSGKHPGPSASDTGKWVGALWDVRQRYGQKFTDEMVALTLKSLNDLGRTGENRELDLNRYFYNSLMSAEFALDNDLSTLPRIKEILKRRNLVPPQTN